MAGPATPRALAPKWLDQLGAESGVAHVATLAAAGSYHRPAPLALDTTHLDAGRHARLAALYRARAQPYAAIRRAMLHGARLAGPGGVATPDGWLLRESIAELLAEPAPPAGFVAAGADGWAMPAASRHIGGPALLLKRPYWRNYGHFLVDAAALAALVARAGPPPPGCRLVIGRHPQPQGRAVMLAALARIVPGLETLEHPDEEVWAFEALHYVTPVHVPPASKHPEALIGLRAALLRDAPDPDRPRRLFVTRGAEWSRRLVNEAELVRLAAARGYEVAHPPDLDLLAQARLFRAATHVVGVKGAALTNLLFCAPGASCLALSPGDFVDPFFLDLAAHAGVGYAELFGPPTARDRAVKRNNFTIDPARFAAMLPD